MTAKQLKLKNRESYEHAKIFGFIQSGANGSKRATLYRNKRNYRNFKC